MFWGRISAYTVMIGLGIIALQPHAAHSLELKPFTAKFQVIRNSVPLGTLDLQLDLKPKGSYNYTGHTKPGAVIKWFISDEVHESSKGQYADRQVVPLNYEYRQGNGKLKKRTLLEFDWETKKVWTTSEGARWSQQLVPGTHDKFSQQLALRLELSAGAKKASFAIADGGRIKAFHYKVVGSEYITLPYGRLKCLKVRRSKENKPPDYTIWFAPELDYLPVKIDRKRKSVHFSMELMQFRDGA